MKKNLAILGAGRIGQVHARAIASNESAVLAAVYDPVEAAVQSVVNRFGGKPATIDEIVQDKSIDAVYFFQVLHRTEINSCIPQ